MSVPDCICEKVAKDYENYAKGVLKAHSEDRGHITDGTGPFMPSDKEGDK